MQEEFTKVLSILNVSASGDGGNVDTLRGPESYHHSARFYLNVTNLAGTSANVQIFAVINGVDHLIHTFTLVTSATDQQNILLNMVPSTLKVVYTLVAVTDFDADVDCQRMKRYAQYG